MSDALNHSLASIVVTKMRANSQTLTIAESCTGGLMCATVTDVPGASAIFTHGFVTYANDAKRDIVNVPPNLIVAHGAVSAPVARAMANGAKALTKSDWAVSVTGIAGPGGGTAEKPVGLVYIGIAGPAGTEVHRCLFPQGSRAFIRSLTVKTALRHLARLL